MSIVRLVTVFSCFGAAAVVVVAVIQIRQARFAAAELAALQREHEITLARVGGIEGDVRRARQRAEEAETDTRDLLKAMESVGAASATGVKRRSTGDTNATRPATAQAGSDKTGTLIRTAAPAAGEQTDQQYQLSLGRAYQQGVAKQRANAATAKAQLEEEIWQLDPLTKFHRRIEAIERYVTEAEFAAANRLLDEALAEKPAEVAISSRIAQLELAVRAQAAPVEVTLISDGLTYVSVAAQRAPARFGQVVIGILPGDYEILGRRTGFRDVTTMLRVRNGAAPPVVTIVCSEPGPN